MKFALTLLLLAAAGAQATPTLISLDTSGLAPGTYYLDLQLAGTDNVAGTNTVSVTRIALGGGAFKSADLTNASGTFPNYSLTDNNYYDDVLIGFTRGSSLRFLLSFTNNFSGSGTPDSFTAALLDASMNSIVTTDLGVSVLVNLDGSATPTIQTFAADAAFGSIRPSAGTPASSVPEPGTLALVAAGCVALVTKVRTRYSQRSPTLTGYHR